MSYLVVDEIGRIRIPGMQGYRCAACKKLIVAKVGWHGGPCPVCGEPAALENVAKVTPKMLAEAETA